MDIGLQDVLVAAIALMLIIGVLAVIAFPILTFVARRKTRQSPPTDPPPPDA